MYLWRSIVLPKPLDLSFLDVVSVNMKSYRLDKKIDGNKILQDIQDLITQFKHNNPDKIPLLYVDIRTISYDDTSHIRKLEHKKIPEP